MLCLQSPAEEPNLHLIPFMVAENAARHRALAEAEKQFSPPEAQPIFSSSVMGLARTYVASGQGRASAAWLELAVHENPPQLLAYHGLGWWARQQKNLEEARRSRRKLSRKKPNYAPSQQELGNCLVELQRYTESAGALTRAAAIGRRMRCGELSGRRPIRTRAA